MTDKYLIVYSYMSIWYKQLKTKEFYTHTDMNKIKVMVC